jgi:hypothetical protein
MHRIGTARKDLIKNILLRLIYFINHFLALRFTLYALRLNRGKHFDDIKHQ